jgi:hypothetical protein
VVKRVTGVCHDGGLRPSARLLAAGLPGCRAASLQSGLPACSKPTPVVKVVHNCCCECRLDLINDERLVAQQLIRLALFDCAVCLQSAAWKTGMVDGDNKGHT